MQMLRFTQHDNSMSVILNNVKDLAPYPRKAAGGGPMAVHVSMKTMSRRKKVGVVIPSGSMFRPADRVRR